jgi:hypothetical protein
VLRRCSHAAVAMSFPETASASRYSERSVNKIDVALALGTAAVLAWGVLQLGWSPFIVLALFWVENAVIGLFNLIRILATGARFGVAGMAGALAFGAFFTVHYGMFTVAHGVFVVMLFGPDAGAAAVKGGFFTPVGSLVDALLAQREAALAIAAIVLLQANATVRWLLRTRELPPPIKDLMTAPYGRIIILHVTLIASGFLVQALGAPTAGALVLVVLKLAYDLRAIRRDRDRDGEDEAAVKARRLLVIGRRRCDGRP